MTKDEALKLALDALEAAKELANKHEAELEYGFQHTITAIKEALLQDELCSSQKPVAWVKVKAAHYMPWYDEKPLQAKLKEKNT